MAEPSSSTLSLTVLAIALLGPAAGPYALIVAMALIGAMWPLSTMPTISRAAGAMFLIRVVGMAVAITAGAAYWLETRYNLPAKETFAVIAFAIGAMGNGWRPVLAGLRNAVVNLVRNAGGSNPQQGPKP